MVGADIQRSHTSWSNRGRSGAENRSQVMKNFNDLTLRKDALEKELAQAKTALNQHQSSLIVMTEVLFNLCGEKKLGQCKYIRFNVNYKGCVPGYECGDLPNR